MGARKVGAKVEAEAVEENIVDAPMTPYGKKVVMSTLHGVMGRPKKRASLPDFYVDFEARDWDQVLCAVVQDSQGGVTRFIGASAAQRVHAMQRRYGGRWHAHAGGIYDHLLAWRDGRYPLEVIMSGSMVLRGKSVEDGKSLYWHDTYPRTLASLAKIGRAVGLEKMEVDRGHAERLSTAELLEYCGRDTAILAKGMTELDNFLGSHGVKALTSGSAAVKLLEAFDPETWGILADNYCDPLLAIGHESLDDVGWHGDESSFQSNRDYTNGALDAVRGGFVETRRIGRVEGPIYCYDLRSCYPSQYFKGRIPVGLELDSSMELGEWGWVDWVTWVQEPGERTAFEVSQDGRGRGILSAWMTWEMAWELDSRGCKPVRHGIGWKGTDSIGNFGRRFVDTLYGLKEGGGLVSFAAKVTLNSLHGKLGENPARFKYVLRDDELTQDQARLQGIRSNWLKRYRAEPAMIWARPTQQPLAAATILTRGRITSSKGVETLECNGWKFYYRDTDCMHCNCPPSEFSKILPLGEAMGNWGLEHHADWAIYLAPKTYYLGPNLIDGKDKGKDKLKAKGMPLDKLDAKVFMEALFRSAEGVKITRTGLDKMRGKKPGTRIELTRTLRPVFHNRKLLEDGRLIYE